MDGGRVVAAVKTPTTAGVSDGIKVALADIGEHPGFDVATVDRVVVGTTHFTNAVVERKRLQRTGCIRLGLPATACLPPMVDWPSALSEVVRGGCFLVHGGHEFDGRELSRFDEAEVRDAAKALRDDGVEAIAISSVFSPVNSSLEERAAAIVKDVIAGANVTLSSSIGRLGLLERENAAILNAALGAVARETIAGFELALAEAGITAPCYISQNDGTVMSAAFAVRHPVLTFASGPTNSMRGAAFLSQRQDAVVIDVGGTTTDVGVLQQGFPRLAAVAADIGGVRTNFRMPDTHSIGLGGGSIVSTSPLEVGPSSVGYELTQKALVFGGDVMTATDVLVATGKVVLGDSSRVGHLAADMVARVEDRIVDMIETALERMKTSSDRVPVILVGGGSILVQRSLSGASEVMKPEHFAVANAVGAATGQAGGECDRIFSLADMSRERALEVARQEAADRAIAAGAEPSTVEIVDIDEVPLAYLPGGATRLRVKAVGDLR